MVRAFLSLLFFLWLIPMYVVKAETSPLEFNDDIHRLPKKKSCLSCHQLEQKRVDPSFMMIREKYKKEAFVAVDIVAQRIQRGSTGIWGPLRMPPQPKVSTEESLKIAQWILE